MAWKEVTEMSERKEFITLALGQKRNMSQLCERFGISRKTGYKWLKRYKEDKKNGLKNQTRRPHSSPVKTHVQTERMILRAREAHPYWGPRKLRAWLMQKKKSELPSVSTMGAILSRNGSISEAEREKHQAYIRFEHGEANALWQMDFKGNFPLSQGRCYPLTILDDHSRFSIALEACRHEREEIVEKKLIEVFRKYGMPERMTMDNGSPWGSGESCSYLTIWLMRLGIRVSHSRPHHPQTQGKDERFHRTLKLELLSQKSFDSFEMAQFHFDEWRYVYNTERPHEALGMQAPISRYRASEKRYPEVLPAIEYGSDEIVRKVDGYGKISYGNRDWKVGKGFANQRVAIRATASDGIFHVFFCQQKIKRLDFHLRGVDD